MSIKIDVPASEIKSKPDKVASRYVDAFLGCERTLDDCCIAGIGQDPAYTNGCSSFGWQRGNQWTIDRRSACK
ncbi:unnamed protein product [marine sediment metagenome]|uniref:Uncharacterized protein n=1 Tax=marine sediment metagenome TaxID=412755 RepID=X0SUL8_9ZZZZ